VAAGTLLLAAAAAGCVVGNLGGDSGNQPPAVTAQELGQAPLRRINRVEYNNTVRDLFKITSSPADAWPADGITSGFDNDISGQGATADLVDQMMRSAEQVADEATVSLDKILPCAAQSGGDPTACGITFIDKYGHRAFRRPLTEDDRTRLGKALAWGVNRGGLKTGVRMVIMTLLQSPHFLYRPEIGVADAAASEKTLALTDHEIATRLSYLLLGSCPDDALLEAADKGEVHTLEQVEAQTERLLESPAGRATIGRFFHQWLPFDRLSKAVKSPELFPEFTDDTKTAMADGALAFVDHVVFESKEGSLRELMTAKYAFVNASTAPLYGLQGSFGKDLEMATLTEPRAGLLTQVGVMAALADNVQSSPVARGKFIFQGLLCQPIGSPPANLPGAGVPPTPDPAKTTRERFDEHRKNPACAGCHQVMDPLGFGLESYDAIGRYRAKENGKAIDSTGDLTLDGAHVSFDGAVELSKIVAESPLTRQCFASKWFTYSFGRPNGATDKQTVADLETAFAEPTSPIKQLFLAVTKTAAFTRRNTPVLEACAQ
jgi:uncharacterized protein DUF1592/uncharacterized protein DUF1588/uncharacterized protein DUF1587/uncharacterized protein DUF1595/uncharacterized protein DUF1585